MAHHTRRADEQSSSLPTASLQRHAPSKHDERQAVLNWALETRLAPGRQGGGEDGGEPGGQDRPTHLSGGGLKGEGTFDRPNAGTEGKWSISLTSLTWKMRSRHFPVGLAACVWAVGGSPRCKPAASCVLISVLFAQPISGGLVRPKGQSKASWDLLLGGGSRLKVAISLSVL